LGSPERASEDRQKGGKRAAERVAAALVAEVATERLDLVRASLFRIWKYAPAGGGPVRTVGSWGSPDRSLLVLTSLAGGPKHGYALTKDI
jgi:hypothetical protein